MWSERLGKFARNIAGSNRLSHAIGSGEMARAQKGAWVTLLVLGFIAILGGPSLIAEAKARGADMFDDYYLDTTNRPRVASDYERPRDVLPQPLPLMNKKYDMLESARRTYVDPSAQMIKNVGPMPQYGREDMLGHARIPTPELPLYKPQPR